MDVIDILGGLLGNKSKGTGAGAKILRDILTGGKQQAPQPQPSPAPRSSPKSSTNYAPTSRELGPGDIERQARELEDLLITAGDRQARRTPAPTQPSRPVQPAPQQNPGFGQSRPAPAPYDSPPAANRQNEQAMVLVRAMVNAAKSDGQISQTEQQNILQQVGESSPEAIEFLRAEFAKPLDVRDFVWSVPLGMEQQVYSISLMAIDLDSNREATYLRDLAHGLRISPEMCDQIHQRLGAPGVR